MGSDVERRRSAKLAMHQKIPHFDQWQRDLFWSRRTSLLQAAQSFSQQLPQDDQGDQISGTAIPGDAAE